MTALDIVAYSNAEGKERRFLRCDPKDLDQYLSLIQDKALQECLSEGVAYYHEALTKQEKRAIEALFTAGAIQVVVASKDTCWGMTMSCQTVVLMGTQFFEGKEHRYIDYPIADVLQMMGRACRPGRDDISKCYVFCPSSKKVTLFFFLRLCSHKGKKL
jgi:pre-mRNA-splicing helicase BRR2